MDANADSHHNEHTDADRYGYGYADTYIHSNQYALSDSHASAA